MPTTSICKKLHQIQDCITLDEAEEEDERSISKCFAPHEQKSSPLVLVEAPKKRIYLYWLCIPHAILLLANAVPSQSVFRSAVAIIYIYVCLKWALATRTQSKANSKGTHKVDPRRGLIKRTQRRGLIKFRITQYKLRETSRGKLQNTANWWVCCWCSTVSRRRQTKEHSLRKLIVKIRRVVLNMCRISYRIVWTLFCTYWRKIEHLLIVYL